MTKVRSRHANKDADLKYCPSDGPGRSFRSYLSSYTILILMLAAIFISPVEARTQAEDETTAVDSTLIDSSAYPAPAQNVTAVDNPNDAGGATIVSWTLSPDDNGLDKVSGYTVYRAPVGSDQFEEVGDAVRGASSITDNKTEDGVKYLYRVDAYFKTFDASGQVTSLASPSVVSGTASSSAQWFNSERFYCLILVLLIGGAIIFYIQQATSGKELYIRKIAGVDAVDEAVGRATEMGRKIFFIPGIQDMNDVQTIAGIAILGRVAERSAEYGAWLEVPVSKSLVMVTARETMKEAYTKAGRPDAYQERQVHFLTDDQFGYAAAIDGMVVREKPATIFYMGAFFAESLILAETGNAAGAIQIAGTAMPSQLPFFVAACDYTLIGEELFAASAYLSREPKQLGSLKGQDAGKGLFLAAIILGIILESFGWFSLSSIFQVK